MSLSYNSLWKELIDRGMTKAGLRLAAGMSSVTLAKLSKGEPVTVSTLERICRILDCDIGDIINYVPDEMSSPRKSTWRNSSKAVVR
jgi:DNA-binding Xre family transcriptional regulator